jgi:hypothetical protein
MAPIDILLLSNGPGELATWVRPVVKALRERLGEDRDQVRLSLVLSPCPNGTGQETTIAMRYSEIDRIQSVEHFWPFLLWGKTADGWDWHKRGVVIFLGGDQFFTVVIAKRLRYQSVVYAEWDVRWPQWVDRFGIRKAEALAKIPSRLRYKGQVVGDLMVEVGDATYQASELEEVAVLPGSKAGKLMMGVPFMLGIADYVHRHRPQTRCFIPMAPTLTLGALNRYSQAEHNAMVTVMDGPKTNLVRGGPTEPSFFELPSGAQVEVDRTFPAYDRLSQCRVAITTVGANTAELGALGVPMVMVLPTQQMDAMRAWNGVPGLLANLPGVGSVFAKLINAWFLPRLGMLAWPNVWAGKIIVPEFVGRLTAAQIGQEIVTLLEQPERLEAMRVAMRAIRGEMGAAAKLVDLVTAVLEDPDPVDLNPTEDSNH